MKRKVAVSALLALSSFGAQAELTMLDAILAEDRVSSSESNLALQNQFVLTREDIISSGATTVTDLMKLAPGFVVREAYGNYRVVTPYGLGDNYPRRVAIIIDGKQFNLASSGTVNLDNLPISVYDIETITIISQPSTATYGASALFGAIVIETRPAASLPREVIATIGNNERKAYISHSFIKDNTVGKLSFQGRQSDGQLNVVEEKRGYSSNIEIAHSFDGKDSLEFNVGLSDYRDTSQEGGAGEIYFPRDSQINYYETKYSTPLNSFNGTLEFGISHITEKNRHNKELDQITFGASTVTPVLATSYDSTRTTLFTNFHTLLSNSDRFSAYASAVYDRETPDTWDFTTDSWNSDSKELRVNYSGKSGSWSYDLSAAYKSSCFESDSSTYNTFSPDIRLSKRIDDKHAINFSISQNHRMLTNWEQYSKHYIGLKEVPSVKIFRNYRVGGLEPEKLTHTRLQWVYQDDIRETRLGYELLSGKDFIGYYFSNFAQFNGTNIFGYYNGNTQILAAGSTDHFDLHRFNFDHTHNLTKGTKLGLNLTAQELKELNGVNNTVVKDSIPNFIAKAAINSKLDSNWSVSSVYNYTSEYIWDGGGRSDTKTGDMGRIDATLNYHKKDYRVALGVRDIHVHGLNRSSYENYEVSPSIFATVNIKL